MLINPQMLDNYHGLTVEDDIGAKKEVADKVFDTLVQKLTVDGHKAVKLTSEVLPGSQTEAEPGTQIVVDLNSKVLSIWIPKRSESEFSKVNVNLDQILSTFRFTN